jgi:hypothetical protein
MIFLDAVVERKLLVRCGKSAEITLLRGRYVPHTGLHAKGS